MRRNVAELTKNRGVAFTFQLAIPWSELNQPEIKGEEFVHVSMDVVYLDQVKGLLITGKFTTTLFPFCNRCLREFPYLLEGDFTEEIELTYEGDKVVCDGLDSACNEDTIDFSQLARDHVLLSLPVKFLCREDCPGLCVVCGQDQAEKLCGCEKESIDPRLEKLKELLND